ncbi:hypothetical protein VHEMI05684 [[Torrubiella] hemipterigena]|uniref:Dipeptidyl aminopeptidase/acylaminoacyl peptidase n=1 Tax=[Torrubiella] hemipterigena TaxID=1531966 RepID=A0A0A1THM5_9HYPO|nr:hypothetical protein VHEMI05684 [[Torrubiella] hemipterigena]
MAHLLNTFFPHNESFNFEALRAAGYASLGAADLGEVITICSRIPSGNEDKWLEEWQKAGDRAITNARTSLSKGNKLDGKLSLLRASNYYRTADFYRRDDPSNDALSKKLDELSGSAFYEAMTFMNFVTTKVEIPYEKTKLPGILLRPDNSNKPRPTLLINGGYDSTKEEVVYALGASALERGFNVLAFDGPGQGETLRYKGLAFRPDWEAVVTPVMDYLVAQPFVDAKKVVIHGVSFGGYLVARGVAFEHRFAAVVLNDGLYSFANAFLNKTPPMGLYFVNNNWDSVVNFVIGWKKWAETGVKWAMCNGRWAFGLKSDAEVYRAARKYTLEGIAHKITTPTLVLDPEDDHFFKNQPMQVFEKLTCEKKLAVLSRDEGASTHCSIGAGARLNQVVWDWLTEVLALNA